MLKSLISDEDGIITSLISSLGISPIAFETDVNEIISKIPNVKVSGGSQIYFSNELLKLLSKAEELAKAAGDSFISIERLFEATSYDESLKKIFEKYKITSKMLYDAIAALRKGKKADTESSEDNFESL